MSGFDHIASETGHSPSPPSLEAWIADRPLAQDISGLFSGWAQQFDKLTGEMSPEGKWRHVSLEADLGDITPYLHIVGQAGLCERLHERAETLCHNGLLVVDGRISPFYNHDFLLSFHLLAELTGEAHWRDRFVVGVDAALAAFFTTPFPPAAVSPGGFPPALKRSAFGFGLLELFAERLRLGEHPALRARCLEIADGLRTVFHRQGVALAPRAGVWALGRFWPKQTQNSSYARLFKDNSNLLFGLLALHNADPELGLGDLIQAVWGECEARFFGCDAEGWAFMGLQVAGRDFKPVDAGLMGNAVGLALRGELLRAGFAVDAGLAERLIATPTRHLLQDGRVAYKAADARSHLDMTVDFAVSAFLYKLEIGQIAEGAEILRHATAAVALHRGPLGYQTLADPSGPQSAICIKYNLLAMKLDIASYVAAYAHQLPQTEIQRLSDIYLIDR